MPAANRPPASNHLLATLPAEHRRNLLADADEVALAAGEVLYTPDAPIRYVYFPTGSFISLMFTVGSVARMEVGLVGDEGALGLPIMLGLNVSPVQAVVQGPGPAIRLQVPRFRRALAQSEPLRRVLNRYLYVSMAQLAQLAACTRFHLLEARLARWLMTTGDRARSNQFRLTHQLLADQLAVRRVGVTTAAGALQRRSLIRYHRGEITILDRSGLESAACKCYRAGRELYDRVLT